jgi:hypothetical protein
MNTAWVERLSPGGTTDRRRVVVHAFWNPRETLTWCSAPVRLDTQSTGSERTP